MNAKKSLFFLVLFFAAFLRLYKLDQIPISMSDDEIRLSYTAYSIWHTGKDLYGKYLPLAFVIDDFAFNPVPIYLVSPVVGIAGLTMFSSRLLFALSGVISIVLLYKITKKITENDTIALLSMAVLTFSAWHIQLSRFAYEGSMALLFFLLGIYLFLIATKRFVVFVFSFCSFVLAFYSYSGTKLILIPIVFSLLWFARKNTSNKRKVATISLIFFCFISFSLLSKFQGASQYGSTPFFFQQGNVAEAVELERRASQAPEFLKRMYHNKATYWGKIFFDHYLYALSPQHLFLNQEGSGIFSVWFRGQFYYIDVIFLLIGFLYLFLYKRKAWTLLLLFILIGPLPSALGGVPFTYTIRSSFLLPWLAVCIGAGIYAVHVFAKGKYALLVYTLIFTSYVYFIGGYLTQYYFEWMRYGSKYYSKGAKDFTLFVQQQKDKKIIAYNTNSIQLLHYGFYTQTDPSKMQYALKNKPFQIDNVRFLPVCKQFDNETHAEIPHDTIYIVKEPCNSPIKPNSIIKSSDNLVEWRMYYATNKK